MALKQAGLGRVWGEKRVRPEHSESQGERESETRLPWTFWSTADAKVHMIPYQPSGTTDLRKTLTMQHDA